MIAYAVWEFSRAPTAYRMGSTFLQVSLCVVAVSTISSTRMGSRPDAPQTPAPPLGRRNKPGAAVLMEDVCCKTSRAGWLTTLSSRLANGVADVAVTATTRQDSASNTLELGHSPYALTGEPGTA